MVALSEDQASVKCLNDDQPCLQERCPGLVGNQPPLTDKGVVMRQVDTTRTNGRNGLHLQNKSEHAAALHKQTESYYPQDCV